MPRTMKEDWNTTPMASAPAQGYLVQQPDQMQNAPMQYDYAMAGDAQQLWMGTEQMPGSEMWGVQMDQGQFQHQMPQFQEQMPQMPMSQTPMPMHEQTLQMMQMQQMQLPQMQAPQMEPPQVHLSQVQSTTPMSMVSGDSTPSDIDGYMAFLMPQAAGEDKEFMALQLKAAAELNQCYED